MLHTDIENQAHTDTEAAHDNHLQELDAENTPSTNDLCTMRHEVGQYVASLYEADWYIGEIVSTEKKGRVMVNYMESVDTNKVKRFRWPARPDSYLTQKPDIFMNIAKPIDKRRYIKTRTQQVVG